MKEFMYTQEKNSQKMIRLKFMIKNYSQKLKVNLLDFLAQVTQHPR